MSSSIQIAGANFSKALTSLTLPDRSQLIGEYVFGGSQANSVKNRANSVSPLTPVGVATYSAMSAKTTSNSVYFNTGLTPGDSSTFILIRGQESQQGWACLMGNDNSLSAVMGLASYQGKSLFYDTDIYTNVASSAGLDGPTPAGVVFHAGVFKRGMKTRVYQYAGGIQSFDDATVARNMTPALVQIGGKTSAVAGVQVENYYAAIFDRAFSADEIQDAYVSLAAYYAMQGVVLV